MSERRYRDDEVRKIFSMATTQKAADVSAPSAVSGLTLAEIQNIGSEAGIEPAAVARAASALDTPAPRPPRTSFGMPVEVGLLVPVPRALTDHEWEQLVTELRSTFRAQGRITAHGSLREWSNGNLSASVEPIESGSRVTLRTLKESAVNTNAIAAVLGIAAGVGFGFALVAETVTPFIAPLMLSSAAGGMFLWTALRLSRWRRERATQMLHIAAKIRSIMGVTD